jgi:nitroimidazol reductase NimA-like FMN-containing flavoprotein (pyridoxamine 5'-phosphate oxidase superfamily)
MGELQSNDTTVRRMPERGHYDRVTVHAILDEGLVAHVGVISNGRPVVMPMVYGRDGDTLYLHGSPGRRFLRSGKKGQDLCVTVTLVDGLVLARSPLHHSANFRSVVVLGQATAVEDLDEKSRILDLITDHVVPGRMTGVRPNTEQELRATLVLALPIDEASAKVRTGPPVDDEEDYEGPHWAGIIPLGIAVGEPVPDPRLSPGIDPPAHVTGWAR